MKNRTSKYAFCFAAAIALVLGGGMQLRAADKKADTVYHNGTICLLYTSPSPRD